LIADWGNATLSIAGIGTLAKSAEEARKNLVEALALVLEANRTLAEESLKGQKPRLRSQSRP
jgi:predicted RNase H-like HicB family nuclease